MYLPSDYYVYAYLREDGTPYYVGKGKNYRAWRKGKGEVRPPKDSNRIIIVEDKLTDLGAFSIERKLISWYGRIDLGTGILRNRTDGGDGGPGVPKGNIGHKHSAATKEKLRNINLGKVIGEPSNEHKEKISAALTGRTRPEFSQKWRDNLSKAGKGKKSHSKGKLWWTNGVDNIQSVVSPGPQWRRGMTKTIVVTKGSTGMHWWTNGKENFLGYLPPATDWQRGRI